MEKKLTRNTTRSRTVYTNVTGIIVGERNNHRGGEMLAQKGM